MWIKLKEQATDSDSKSSLRRLPSQYVFLVSGCAMACGNVDVSLVLNTNSVETKEKKSTLHLLE